MNGYKTNLASQIWHFFTVYG